MRVFGMNYDTGFVSGGSTTHEPFDPETVRRDLRVIRDELFCDAVRITGRAQPGGRSSSWLIACRSWSFWKGLCSSGASGGSS